MIDRLLWFFCGVVISQLVTVACANMRVETPAPDATEAASTETSTQLGPGQANLLTCSLTEKRGLLSVTQSHEGACDEQWSRWVEDSSGVDALSLRCFEAACGSVRSVGEDTATDWEVIP